MWRVPAIDLPRHSFPEHWRRKPAGPFRVVGWWCLLLSQLDTAVTGSGQPPTPPALPARHPSPPCALPQHCQLRSARGQHPPEQVKGVETERTPAELFPLPPTAG